MYSLNYRGIRAVHVEAPPEFVILGATGNDDGRYGFLVDDPTEIREEYPIGEFYGDGTGKSILASDFREFLAVRIAQAYEDFDFLEADERRQLRQTTEVLQKELNAVPISNLAD